MTINFEQMQSVLVKAGGKRVAVAVAADEDVLGSILQARDLGIAKPILVGDEAAIKAVAAEHNLDLGDARLVNVIDPVEACAEAVRLVREGEADALMKGLVSTATIIKAVLNKETGIRDAKLLSHLGMFDVPILGRPIFVTDAALAIAPDVDAKELILRNAVDALHKLGYEKPKVACVCALEKLNPAMQATVDAAELVDRFKDATDCQVGGPFALDNTLFLEAAKTKGVTDPVAGIGDILLMPNIEAGNVLYKALSFIAQCPGAGIILGAKAPVIVTSRADHEETKLRSIILALYMARGEN